MTYPHIETIWFLDTRIHLAMPAARGADRISVLEHWAPFGHSPPLHIHDTEDEVFRVLDGRLRFQVDGEEIRLAAGDMLLAPKGVAHTFCVDSEDGAHFMTVTRPGDFEAMVRECSRPAGETWLPESLPPTPDQVAHLEDVCAHHGIRLVGAPLAARIAA
jgi:mannose-6-phosphate isomerase-like protein (cupin superfamily)